MMEKTLVFDVSSEGLDPMKHRVVGITTKSSIEERIFTDRDEKKVLEDFWAYVRANEFEQLVGFNSSHFDSYMLIIRSIKHKVACADLKGKMCDLRQVLFGNEHVPGKLSDFKELLELDFPPSKYRKMHMSLLWEAPNLQNLKEFLLEDVRITWELYKSMNKAGLA